MIRKQRCGRLRFAGSFLLLLLPLWVACAPRKPAPDMSIPIVDRAAPDWLRMPPDDPGYIHGIGFTPQGPDPAVDERLALERAREALLESIQGRLRSTLAASPAHADLWQRVAWDGLYAELTSIPAEDLFVDRYKRRVYAYMRISSKALNDLLGKRRENLEPRARRSLAAAREALEKGQISTALREQLVALHRVAGPEGLLPPDALPEAILRLEVEREMQRLLSMLEFKRSSGALEGRLASLEKATLTVQVLSQPGSIPVPRMPVTFHFSAGNGEVTPTGVAGNDGQATARILAIDPRTTPIEVTASLDLQALLTSSRLTPLPDAALSAFTLPRTSFQVLLEAPRLLLTYIERGGTGGTRGSIVAHEIAEAFRSQGLIVQEADVNMLVNPEVFKEIEAGRDPGDVKEVDYVGVVSISLQKLKTTRSRYQDVISGEGVALFRLYDVAQRRLILDLRVPQTVNGFSQGDVERSFFLQSVDDLRARVVDELTEQPFYSWSR